LTDAKKDNPKRGLQHKIGQMFGNVEFSGWGVQTPVKHESPGELRGAR